MNYRLLSKVYYQNIEEYEELYNKRINSENTKKLNIKIHDNWAFYCLSQEIYDLSIKIMETDKKVQVLKGELPGVAIEQFANKSLIDEIFLTNDIEGVYSTRKEIKMILNESDESPKRKKRRFRGLVTRYKMLGRDKTELNTCGDIRAIYDELVLPDIISEEPSQIPDGKIFRKSMAEVTTTTQKVIHQGLYPEEKIIEGMEDALHMLKDESIPVLVRIAAFHYFFGYIHPFYDGNGRTSRFISSYLLAGCLDKLIGCRLSYTIKENLSDYYEAFKLCNDKKNRGDITPFVITFLGIICTALERLYGALYDRKELLNQAYEDLGKIQEFSDDDIKEIAKVLIQAALFSVDGISVKELCDCLDVSESTVRKKLKWIENAGYLLALRVGKYKYYKFNIEKIK